MPAAQPHDRGRGIDLLLAHCSALGDDEDVRPSPTERLEAAIGDDLARLLLNALTGDHSRGRRFGFAV